MLRDRVSPESATALFLREARATANAVVDDLSPGTYTACAAPLPADPARPEQMERAYKAMDTLPLRCASRLVDGQTQLTIIVPAAWTAPR